MKRNQVSIVTKCFAAILFASAILTSCTKDDDPSNGGAGIPLPREQFNRATDNINLQKDEFRAAWISTAWGLDWPQGQYNMAAQKESLKNYFDKLKDLNFNVVMFQVRPFADALYESDICPWSAAVSGAQGTNPGYDPLAYAIELAGERGMELHAWLNPYRVGSVTLSYAPTSIAVTHPEYIIAYKGNNYLNPGMPEVVAHLREVVIEITHEYRVDGIHFDDYFYPSGAKSVATPFAFNDEATYNQYGGGLSLNNWREANVTNLIAEIKNTITAIPHITFGVSPQGVHNNGMAIYANAPDWMDKKLVDYLAPQIYWEFGHATADFGKQLKFWVDKSEGNNTPVIPGLAAYKHGDPAFPFYTPQMLERQVNAGRAYDNVYGNCWFRAQNILRETLTPTIASSIYSTKAFVPKLGSYTEPTPGIPAPVLTGKTISWNSTGNTTQYAVYELEQVSGTRDWNTKLVYKGRGESYTGESKKNYFVISINKRVKSEYLKVVYIP